MNMRLKVVALSSAKKIFFFLFNDIIPNRFSEFAILSRRGARAASGKYSALSPTSLSSEAFTPKGIVVCSTLIARCISQGTLWKDLSPVHSG
jgi:hypothetical protein